MPCDTNILLYAGWIFGGLIATMSLLTNITVLSVFLRKYTLGLVVKPRTAKEKVTTEGASFEEKATNFYPYIIALLGIAVIYLAINGN